MKNIVVVRNLREGREKKIYFKSNVTGSSKECEEIGDKMDITMNMAVGVEEEALRLYGYVCRMKEDWCRKSYQAGPNQKQERLSRTQNIMEEKCESHDGAKRGLQNGD